VTLLEAPEPPPRLPSNSLLADSVARLVSAATVEAMLAAGLAVELEVLLEPAAVLAGIAAATEAWLLPMLPIDIMGPDRDCWNQGYRPGFEELEQPLLRRAIHSPAPQRTPHEFPRYGCMNPRPGIRPVLRNRQEGRRR